MHFIEILIYNVFLYSFQLDHIPIYAELPNSIVGKKISFNVSFKGDSTKFGYSPYVVDCYLDDQNIIDEWL